ncbi:MAG TPA: cupin domain-containing protein [Candidatus Saccharimonadales bacterium]|nr:cupin domain-containing protein [Candidatus Saccharimonadales bacterium]
MSERIRRVRANELSDGPATPGMARHQAVATDLVWAGLVHTDPGAVSAWHHHGDHESVIYVLSGALRMECGPRGEDVFDAQPGEFIHVPPYSIHREGNTTDQVATLVVTRSGHGESVLNVDGPEGGVSSRLGDSAS